MVTLNFIHRTCQTRLARRESTPLQDLIGSELLREIKSVICWNDDPLQGAFGRFRTAGLYNAVFIVRRDTLGTTVRIDNAVAVFE